VLLRCAIIPNLRMMLETAFAVFFFTINIDIMAVFKPWLAMVYQLDNLCICPDTSMIWMMRIVGTPVNNCPFPEDFLADTLDERKHLILIIPADHAAVVVIPCRIVVAVREVIRMRSVVVAAICGIMFRPIDVAAERMVVYDIDFLDTLFAVAAISTDASVEDPFDQTSAAGIAEVMDFHIDIRVVTATTACWPSEERIPGIVEVIPIKPVVAIDCFIVRAVEVTRAILNSHLYHAGIRVSVCIGDFDLDPDRASANVFAAKLDIGSELGVIGYAVRAPSLPHACCHEIVDFAIIIASIVEVIGIHGSDAISTQRDHGVCITNCNRRSIVPIATRIRGDVESQENTHEE
jgi:hypothetical protein